MRNYTLSLGPYGSIREEIRVLTADAVDRLISDVALLRTALWSDQSPFRRTVDISVITVKTTTGNYVHTVTFSRKLKNFWRNPRLAHVHLEYRLWSCADNRTITLTGDKHAGTAFYQDVAAALNWKTPNRLIGELF